MIHKITIAICFVAMSGLAVAQNTTSTPAKKRPDLPGTFVLEFGFNRDLTGPDNFSLNFFGSRAVNVYYQYDMRILNSKFSFVPGIGLSLERFSFKKGRTLSYNANDSLELFLPSQIQVDVRKSALVTNYIDVPLEFRYTSKPDDPARAFKISIGGRVGYMYDSFMKVKYKENNEFKKYKDKQDYNLTQFRYGVSAKVGFGNFALFAYYNLTDLFKSGEGPYINNTVSDFPTGTIGISLSSF